MLQGEVAESSLGIAFSYLQVHAHEQIMYKESKVYMYGV